MRALPPEAFPAVCASAVLAALATATVAFANEPTPVLVFVTPDMDVIVAAYDTAADCDEVAWTLNRYVAGDAHYTCEPETALQPAAND